jgi:Lrp/AsnC family transcriptional regulator, leucine-responsive regulatory protein
MIALDRIDRALLNALQQNAKRSYAELGASVNLSESSVRRRVEALRASGVITHEVVLLDPALIGGVQLIVSVCFERESPELYARFRQHMQALAEVQQCYSVAGEVDFVLIVHAPDLASFERWGERELMGWPGIRRYSSQVVWSRTKFVTNWVL